MRGRIQGAAVGMSLVLLLSVSFAQAGNLTISDQRGSLESALRGPSQDLYGAPRVSAGTSKHSLLGGETLGRLKHGAYSLLIPGWSQWRSGHNGRAIAFATAEALVWGTWGFSKLQANHREDQYVDFAQQFAQVQNGDHADEYWRALASYRDSDDFNAEVRADVRAGLQPDSALIATADAWRWQSERRFREFQQMRADALSAQDRADLVIAFALLTRVAAFVDAVRSGPPAGDSELSQGQSRSRPIALDVRPSLSDPSAKLSYRLQF